MAGKKITKHNNSQDSIAGYNAVLSDFVELLEASRRASARVINSIMTATYWEIGRRIVEIEQRGKERSDYYGEEIIKRLSKDLTKQFGRGFGRSNLFQMRLFYLAYQNIVQTLSGQSADIVQKMSAQSLEKTQTMSAKFDLREIAQRFPLSWSHYVKLLAVKDAGVRSFYESESLRSGWTVRQLDRQINSQFYQRALLSKNKAAMLTKGAKPKLEDFVSADEEIKDPFVLEFLNLKDEYSENDLEAAIIEHLENFMLELGAEYTFVGRQKRLRIDDEWFRVDLVFYHRRLRCLILIDLKLGKLTHADVGQMHLYCNYAVDNWTLEGENPPVGLILCASKGENIARYSLDNLPNKILAREYMTVLPNEEELKAELEKARLRLMGLE